MRTCCALGCKSTSKNNDGAVKYSFHKLPLRKPELLEKWLQAICYKRENFTPTASSMLCSLHFENSAFEPDNPQIRRLKADAVPSLFSYGPAPKHRKRPRNWECISPENGEYTSPENWEYTSSKVIEPPIKVAKVTIPSSTSAHQKPQNTSSTEYQGPIIVLDATTPTITATTEYQGILDVIQPTIMCDKATQAPSDEDTARDKEARGRKPLTALQRKAQLRAVEGRIVRRDKKIEALQECIKQFTKKLIRIRECKCCCKRM